MQKQDTAPTQLEAVRRELLRILHGEMPTEAVSDALPILDGKTETETETATATAQTEAETEMETETERTADVVTEAAAEALTAATTQSRPLAVTEAPLPPLLLRLPIEQLLQLHRRKTARRDGPARPWLSPVPSPNPSMVTPSPLLFTTTPAPYIVRMIDAMFGEADLQPPFIRITRDGLHESLNELKEAAALQATGPPSPLLVSLAAATPLFLLALLLVGAPLGVLLALALALPVASLLLYSNPAAAAARAAGRAIGEGSRARDAFALGRQRSCGLGDRWLSDHEKTGLLFGHDLGYGGNGTSGASLAAWLQVAGRGNGTVSGTSADSARPALKVTSGARPAGWRWDWWLSNMTAAERRFQSRVSAVLVRPLVRFSARLGGEVPPAALWALLKKLRTESQPAVLAALREVTGSGGPERLLQRDGGLVRTLASAVTELVVLTSGAARQIEWAAAPLLRKTNNSSSDLLTQALRTLGSSAPFAFGAAAVVTIVPLTLLTAHLLLGVPVALLVAVSLYGALLGAGALARSLFDAEDPAPEAGLLLGRAVEAVLGGFFRMKMLRTLLMFALERMAG
ncbi:hypothetical protein FJT64_005586 [Amphibalanus amphitrite]|uniref:Uncharacterized protein n=1 Tax=Amphibalanus amphitrite TaxID=1232801 RepID=A0A6A4VVN2_AMPAM|nr:hypothetical protein FJT64_005586 [Amphibalanus amphitrite]